MKLFLTCFVISLTFYYCEAKADREQPPTISTIMLVGEQWKDYTNADGSGVYWDLIKSIYQPAGVKVHFKLYPWVRADRMVIKQRADAIVGDYYYPTEDGKTFLYPYWHLSVEEPIVMISKKPGRYSTPITADKRPKLIGFIRGYGFEHKTWFKPDFEKYELNDLEHGLKMLAADRLHAVADYASHLSAIAHNTGFSNKDTYKSTQMEAGQRLYLKFANTKRARALIEIYDRRVNEMIENGEIEKILRKWHLPKTKFYRHESLTLE